MSLLLIAEPTANDGTNQSNYIAAKSQIYFQVQRADVTSFSVANVGGKARFTFTSPPTQLDVGQFFYCEPNLATGGVTSEYNGQHQLTAKISATVWDTSTDFVVSGIATGVINFQVNSPYTVRFTLNAIKPAWIPYYIEFKIPYNNAVLEVDLSEAYRPIFTTFGDYVVNVVPNITAADAFGGGNTGSAIGTYNLQLFDTYIPRGNSWGSNLLNYILFPSPSLGRILTQFENPKIYDDFPRFYEAYSSGTQTAIIAQGYWLNVNGGVVAGPTNIAQPDLNNIGIHKIINIPQAPTQPTYKALQLQLRINNGLLFTPLQKFYVDCRRSGQIAIAWKNQIGGTEMLMFDISKNDSLITTDAGFNYETGGIESWADTPSRLKSFRGSNYQEYTLTASGLSENDLWAVQTILQSTEVNIVTNFESSPLIKVKVTSGWTVAFNTAQKQNHTFSCVIQLPKDTELLQTKLNYTI